MIEVKNKFLFSEKTNFSKDKNEDYMMTARIVPFGIISRNGVMYDKESVIKTHKNLVGKPVLFNHKKDEDNTPPRGEWIGTEIRNDGMYGTAKIFNTTYNQNLIEYLLKSKNATVSLEIFGKAEKRIDEDTGIQYNVAFIKEWLESSIVNLPGFNEAKVLSFECYIAESLGLGIQKQDGGNIMEKDLIEKVEKLSEKFDKQTELLEKIVEGIEIQSESFKKLKESAEVETPEAEKSTEAVKEPKAEEASEEVSEEPKAEEEAVEEPKAEEVSEESKAEEEAVEESKAEEKAKEESKAEEKAKDKSEDKEESDEEEKSDDEEESEKPKAKKEAKKESEKCEETKTESLNTEEVDKPQEPINVQKESAKVEFKEDNKNINKEEMFREVLRKAFQK
jgi:hypothetical protein